MLTGHVAIVNKSRRKVVDTKQSHTMFTLLTWVHNCVTLEEVINFNVSTLDRVIANDGGGGGRNENPTFYLYRNVNIKPPFHTVIDHGLLRYLVFTRS